MKLQELLKDVAVLSNTAGGAAEINEVRYDSRAVQKGDLFVAIRGYATDGHKYIAKALEQGAAAVVCEEAPEGVPAVVVENSRIALAEIAANRFGHPADSMVMLGVTGTNGKTTTTYLVKHMLEDAGHKVGLIGTNQNLIGSEVIETERTTPESYELHALFARMRDAGCTHVIMEVSSHSLVLDRVHGIRFAVGAFTNLTQDHLDFHKTMENYRQAKAILFTVSDKGVINLDDAAAPKMLADAKCPCLTYSCGKPEATLCATALQLHADGVEFDAAYEGASAHVKLPIPGHFSVENALNALGMVLSLGMPLADAAKSLATATGVKGRVVALFGCGGDRDRTKRPKMGKIASDLADFCVVTSDNPRTEQPQAIIDDILEGMKDSKTPMQVIVDRPEAIHWALAHAQKDDIIVLMGKGHETYQEVNHVKHHMDEREIVADYFKN